MVDSWRSEELIYRCELISILFAKEIQHFFDDKAMQFSKNGCGKFSQLSAPGVLLKRLLFQGAI